ncbi:MAG: hypothetical protein ACRC4M_02185 [Mycoplasma sp.]
MSLKLASPLTSDKKLSKLISSINSIDEAILKNVNNDIELFNTQNFKFNLSNDYNALNFIINNVDQELLNNINNEISDIENRKNDFFLLDQSGKLSHDSLNKFEQQDQILERIKSESLVVEEKIKLFPKTSNADLKTLNKVLEDVKIKLKNKTYDNRVITAKVEVSKDLKNLYYFFMSLLLTGIVAIIITVIIIVV